MTTARLVVSVHDVAPASAEESRSWLAELDRRAVPASLLVVPGPWRGAALADDPHFAAWLRERAQRGDDIVQHGWRHHAGADGCGWRVLTERAIARGAGEFAALSQQAAALRLRAGRSVLARAGLPTSGFTAPGWLHSPGTLRALKAAGFTYTTTHTGVLDLRTGRRHTGPALSHRAGGAGEALAARILIGGAHAVLRMGGLIRIALHPDDLDTPGLRVATLTAIDACLVAGATPCTYRAVVGSAAGHVAA
jgi:predicted deacetylase